MRRVISLLLAFSLVGLPAVSQEASQQTVSMTLSEVIALLERQTQSLSEDLQREVERRKTYEQNWRESERITTQLWQRYKDSRKSLTKAFSLLLKQEEITKEQRERLATIESSLELSGQALKRLESEIRKWKFRARLRGAGLILLALLFGWREISR